MANETTKAIPRRAKDPLFQEVFKGRAVDIGGGNDPLKPTPEFQNLQVEWVIDLGGIQKNLLRVDAESMGEQEDMRNRYDLVYSSQCLEHLRNPFAAIWNWWNMVKVGGHLVLTVPDFVLYEQGIWPHRWNSNHLTAWRLNDKAEEPDPSPGSIPLRQLIAALPNANVRRCQIVDTNYDYDLLARIQLGEVEPVDQTMGNAEAWIEAVVQKVK